MLKIKTKLSNGGLPIFSENKTENSTSTSIFTISTGTFQPKKCQFVYNTPGPIHALFIPIVGDHVLNIFEVYSTQKITFNLYLIKEIEYIEDNAYLYLEKVFSFESVEEVFLPDKDNFIKFVNASCTKLEDNSHGTCYAQNAEFFENYQREYEKTKQKTN